LIIETFLNACNGPIFMKQIKMEALHAEVGEVQYLLEIPNGDTSTSTEFYGQVSEFKEFALGLISFPKNIKDQVTYEIGEVGSKYCVTKVFWHFLGVVSVSQNGHWVSQNPVNAPQSASWEQPKT